MYCLEVFYLEDSNATHLLSGWQLEAHGRYASRRAAIKAFNADPVTRDVIAKHPGQYRIRKAN